MKRAVLVVDKLWPDGGRQKPVPHEEAGRPAGSESSSLPDGSVISPSRPGGTPVRVEGEVKGNERKVVFLLPIGEGDHPSRPGVKTQGVNGMDVLVGGRLLGFHSQRQQTLILQDAFVVGIETMYGQLLGPGHVREKSSKGR